MTTSSPAALPSSKSTAPGEPLIYDELVEMTEEDWQKLHVYLARDFSQRDNWSYIQTPYHSNWVIEYREGEANGRH